MTRKEMALRLGVVPTTVTNHLRRLGVKAQVKRATNLAGADLEQFFWSQVERGDSDACWPWRRSCGRPPRNYGIFYYGDGNRKRHAHRFAYEVTEGAIPEGMEACHSCDNPPCCNPAHLFLGSHSENVRDALKKGRGGTQKLGIRDVRAIRKRLRAGERGSALAREYGVNASVISRIKNRKRWGWI